MDGPVMVRSSTEPQQQQQESLRLPSSSSPLARAPQEPGLLPSTPSPLPPGRPTTSPSISGLMDSWLPRSFLQKAPATPLGLPPAVRPGGPAANGVAADVSATASLSRAELVPASAADGGVLPSWQDAVGGAPEVVGLQPVGLVDHMAVVDWSALQSIPGERGGSQRVNPAELDVILANVNAHTLPLPGLASPVRTLPGGSVGNTVAALGAGLGVRVGIVGACGTDEHGSLFCGHMERAGVLLARMRRSPGLTGRCACLVDAEGNRTMRPCLSEAVRLKVEDLDEKDFQGTKWVVMNGYGFYAPGLLEKAVELAKAAGAKVSLDLASFEVVRNFQKQLLDLLASGKIDLCFANEDEAVELCRKELAAPKPEDAVAVLRKYCPCVVVMLGPKGCIAAAGEEVVRVPALTLERPVVDTTGAGDLFAAGFLAGLLRGLPLADCARLGCATGGAVVQSLGARVEAHGWAWMHAQVEKSLPSAAAFLPPPPPVDQETMRGS